MLWDWYVCCYRLANLLLFGRLDLYETTEIKKESPDKFQIWRFILTSQALRAFIRPWPIEEKATNRYNSTQFMLFPLHTFSLPFLSAEPYILGFGRIFTVLRWKTVVFPLRIRGSFIALFGKQLFVITKVRRLSWCPAAILRGNNSYFGSQIVRANGPFQPMQDTGKVKCRWPIGNTGRYKCPWPM
jgi:hypothetical protein